MKMSNVAALPCLLEHTLLRPETTAAEIDRAAGDAVRWGCAALCVAPVWLATAAPLVRGSAVRLCTVIGFPHGANKTTVKAIEATTSIKDGAEEIDVVAHLPHLLAGDLHAARGELMEIVRTARATRRDVVVKVIVESALLMSAAPDAAAAEVAIALACRAVRESGCDYIKTSTGFHPAGGASIEAVRLMKKHAQSLLVKASGGIRDLATARAMVEAGADRIGTSSTGAILTELQRQQESQP